MGKGEGRRGMLRPNVASKGWSGNNLLELTSMEVGDYPPYSYFFDKAEQKRHYWCAYHLSFGHGTDRCNHKPAGWKYGDPTDYRPRYNETIQQSYALAVDDDGTYVRTIQLYVHGKLLNVLLDTGASSTYCSSDKVEIPSAALRQVHGITKYGLGQDSITVRTTQRAILQFQLRLDSEGMQCDAIVCSKSLYDVILGCGDYERMFAPVHNNWDKLLFIPTNEVVKTTKVFMTEVEIIHQKVKLIKYLNPDREWF
jgi:hypothetical protein